jgi:elongation factor Ts
VLDPEQTVAQAVEAAEAVAGTAITVAAFVRFKVGEGLEPPASAAG